MLDRDFIESVTVADWVNGYMFDEKAGEFRCLHCNTRFMQGEIFSIAEKLVDAKKAVSIHVTESHGSPFNALLRLDKKQTGITDTQKAFLEAFYEGKPDSKTAELTGTSQSTVRFQRYSFKEKAKQAKLMLAILTLLEERKEGGETEMMNIPNGTRLVDERFMVTEEEERKILKTSFESLEPPVLKHFSTKEKKKLVALKVIAAQFARDKKYTEKEVNAIIKPIYEDFVTIRRYLIEYGFMDRVADGSQYWLV